MFSPTLLGDGEQRDFCASFAACDGVRPSAREVGEGRWDVVTVHRGSCSWPSGSDRTSDLGSPSLALDPANIRGFVTGWWPCGRSLGLGKRSSLLSVLSIFAR